MYPAAPPAVVTIYHLRVTLRDVSPLVWRRVLVRSDTTIAQLHDVLQIAMGWEDMHLQQFRIHGKAYGVYHEGGMTFADNPHSVRLSDFRLRAGERFVYEYDFGDFWQHDIRLEQMGPPTTRTHYPVCTAGSGDCPPEDCGGPAGYAAFLQERGSGSAMHEVSEATAVVAERICDWQQGGPQPSWDDEEFSSAMDRMSDWLDEAPAAFNRRAINAALREKCEKWTCSSAYR
jgi:hypothetical protein